MIAACQICGRQKHICITGLIAKHYTGGEVCAGSDYVPFFAGCSRIDEVIALHRASDQRCLEIYKRHRDERRNEPLSAAFWRTWHYAVSRTNTLERRLKRWHREHGLKIAA